MVILTLLSVVDKIFETKKRSEVCVCKSWNSLDDDMTQNRAALFNQSMLTNCPLDTIIYQSYQKYVRMESTFI